MRLFNPVRFDFQADGDPAASAKATSPDPGEKPRFFQSDLDRIAGTSRAEGQARADEQWKGKYDKLITERDTFKGEAEKLKSVSAEFEAAKPLLEEHKTLKVRVRQTDLERELERQGCSSSHSQHVRVLLEHDKVISEEDIKDWKPVIEKAKQIMPTAFSADPAKQTGGTATSGKTAGTEKPSDDPAEMMRKRWSGK